MIIENWHFRSNPATIETDMGAAGGQGTNRNDLHFIVSDGLQCQRHWLWTV